MELSEFSLLPNFSKFWKCDFRTSRTWFFDTQKYCQKKGYHSFFEFCAQNFPNFSKMQILESSKSSEKSEILSIELSELYESSESSEI